MRVKSGSGRPTLGPAVVSNGIWVLAVRIRNLLKKLHLLGPLDGVSAYFGPRLLPPPSHEVSVRIAYGMELLVEPRSPSFRNYATGLYELDVTRLIMRICQPGMSAVDLGANVGYYTLLLSHLVGPKGRVYAFEPDASTFAYLEKNLVGNRCDNVIASERAVGDGTAPVYFEASGPERGFVASRARSTNTVTVASTTLDSFFAALDWPPVDLIKMDIEGSEERALIGMRALIARNPQLRIVMEWNSTALQRSGASASNIVSQLTSGGFTEAYVVETAEKVALHSLRRPSRAIHNLLITRSGA